MHQLKRSSKFLSLSGFVLLFSLVVASVVFAAALNVTDSLPGYADGNQIARSVTINDPGAVMDVNVAVDFHKIPSEDCSDPFMSGGVDGYSEEISISLRSAAGTTVNLVYDDLHHSGPTYTRAIAPSNRVVVSYDDEAVAPAGGPVPVAGAFRPAEPLSAFDGEPASGEWVLTLGDSVSGDYLCYYSFTLNLVTDSVAATPDVTLADGSLNPRHLGRPIAIYAADDGGYTVYGIDINTGRGALALTITPQMIAEAGIPAGGPVIITEGQNPYNYRPFTLYRLPSGEFQLNTYYWDGKPYNVKWSAGDSHVTTVNW